MLAEERRSRLLEMVRQRGFASLPELAGELAVSESTVRRDLDFLEKSGEAKKTYGGVFYTGPSPKLPHFDMRQAAHWEEKRLIGRRAAELIEDGDAILLDGGSTTYELAQCLVGRPLQVVTNSLPVANLFASSDAADLVIVGGDIHSRTGVTLGPYAVEMLSKVNVRWAVISVAGINERGYYNSSRLVVETERAMMQAADQVIVVADSTKFGHSSVAHLCDLGEVKTHVVDHKISEEWRSRLAAAGVNVLVAGGTDNG
jgi:DeoR/GlpR family transcriptional regulator of sugar metabolism